MESHLRVHIYTYIHTTFERELASMKEELLSQMNIIAKSINDRSQIDSVGQIAAMIKWDIRFDAGNYYRLSKAIID